MTQATADQSTFLTRFGGLADELASSGPAWLQRARKAARSRFEALGFPGTDDEEWRNTNVAPIAATAFERPRERSLPDNLGHALGEIADSARLVFIDGRLAPALSRVGPLGGATPLIGLAQALAADSGELEAPFGARSVESMSAFCALNTVLGEDGAMIRVPAGLRLDEPLHVIYASTGGTTPTASHPRTVLLAGRGSRCRLIESYVGLQDGVYLTNAVTDVILEADAEVEHYRVQLESEQAFHVSTIASRQGRDSRFRSHNVNLGGRLVRHDVVGLLDGEGGQCQLDGLYLTRGLQHVDNHTVLDHAKPHCDSREVYKGILAGKSRAVFHGRIIVRPDAQQTDAKQSNPNLLLSLDALAHTRPQLEIYADDVKCTHGATIGRLDDEAIFYLRSRAVPEPEARRLLIDAFAADVIDRIEVASLRAFLADEIERRLRSVAGG